MRTASAHALCHLHIPPALHSALGNEHPVLRNTGPEPSGISHIHCEITQIPVVDPDDARPAADRHADLLLVMRFDDRRKPESSAEGKPFPDLLLRKDRADEQDRVRAGLLRLIDHIRIDREILPQDRQAHRLPDLPKNAKASPEPIRLRKA